MLWCVLNTFDIRIISRTNARTAELNGPRGGHNAARSRRRRNRNRDVCNPLSSNYYCACHRRCVPFGAREKNGGAGRRRRRKKKKRERKSRVAERNDRSAGPIEPRSQWTRAAPLPAEGFAHNRTTHHYYYYYYFILILRVSYKYIYMLCVCVCVYETSCPSPCLIRSVRTAGAQFRLWHVL